jgi:2-amino-4-hydroxy-6-hydroxymethyldihydropteridine diphosphokinase
MILVSIGANLPAQDGASPLETCRRAALALDGLPGLRLRGLSRWYETEPVLGPGETARSSPNYVNGMACLTGEPKDPAELLARLIAIEAAAGRTRSVRNAPRVLDLDIIAIGNMVRREPDPILPHPRAHERAFVLAPLAEVAPGWVHPVLARSVEELLSEVCGQELRVIEA